MSIYDDQDRIINNILEEGINNILLSQPNQTFSNRKNVTYSYDYHQNNNNYESYNYSTPKSQSIYPYYPITYASQTLNYPKNYNSFSSQHNPKTEIKNEKPSIIKMKKHIINLQTKICGLYDKTQPNTKRKTEQNKKQIKTSKSFNNKIIAKTKQKSIQKRMNTISSGSISITKNPKNTIRNNSSSTLRRNKSSNIVSNQRKKEMTSNEIWKEKYELLIDEYDQVKTLLDKEKKDNEEMKKKILSTKKKENQIGELTKYNQELCNSKNNLIQKYQQSEQIRREQIKIIQRLQGEVNKMRYDLANRSPSF